MWLRIWTCLFVNLLNKVCIYAQFSVSHSCLNLVHTLASFSWSICVRGCLHFGFCRGITASIRIVHILIPWNMILPSRENDPLVYPHLDSQLFSREIAVAPCLEFHNYLNCFIIDVILGVLNRTRTAAMSQKTPYTLLLMNDNRRHTLSRHSRII